MNLKEMREEERGGVRGRVLIRARIRLARSAGRHADQDRRRRWGGKQSAGAEVGR